nr:arginyl tRNA protein transferase 1 [Hymenolepis microstoma]
MDSGWRRSGTYIYKTNNRITCCPAYTIRCDAKHFRISRAQKRVLHCRGDCPENSSNFPKSRLNFSSLASEKVASPTRSDEKTSSNSRERRLGKNKPKELEELLDSGLPQEGAAHFIDIRLCRSAPKSNEFNSTLQQEFDIYKAYQIKIHKDNPNRVTPRSFEEFLVTSPLISKCDKQAKSAGAPQFGSYHQQYWLDGNILIAVGVIDLVPGCLSSVYLFYDPEYAFLHLGTYCALREIAFVRHLYRSYGQTVPAYADFTYYYMGYYIHSCVKMRYKAAFTPSYLVCPETKTWVPVERCKRLLNVQKYTRFAEDSSTSSSSSSYSTDSIVIMLRYSYRLASMLPSSSYTLEDGKIVTTLGAASTILSEYDLQLVKEWRGLVTSMGSMRIDLCYS